MRFGADGRTIHAPDGFPIADAIQTDAAVNPGNSGGPLLDPQGRVIGVTSQIRTENGNDGNTGVGFGVAGVVARGPGARAGIRRGDRIVAVDGRAVRTPDDLTALVARHRPGERGRVTIVRGGDRRTLTVTLGKRPDTPVSG